jgi:sigma-B regulation protein RsbU (phosphoserine phosphatase)
MSAGDPASTAVCLSRSEVAVLVVDDSSVNRLLLKRRLVELGYDNISTASNGVEALAAIDGFHFDVVLLDMEMPVLDGFGVLEGQRAAGRRDPPIIVVSALTEMAAVVRAIELGAEDYLPKTFDPTLLRARLSAVLDKKRLRDLAAGRLRLLEAELESARRAQLALAPSDFAAIAAHRIDVHAVMVPARQVGGDFYDALRLDDRTLLFAVADVAGKGAPAALTMARTLGLFRSSARHLASQGGVPDPAAILDMANRDLAHDNQEATFVTAALGIIDMSDGRGRLAIAGHDMPLRYSADGAVAPLLPPNPQFPLGAVEAAAFESRPFALAPGEGMVLFSDGVTEAENAAGEFFGRDQLISAVGAVAGADVRPRAIVENIFSAVTRFADGAPQADDITALGLCFD